MNILSLMRVTVFCLCVSFFEVNAYASSPLPVGSSSPSPSAAVVPQVTSESAAGTEPVSIPADQVKQLLREFKKAQYTEWKAFEHRQRLEYQELKVAQGAQRKVWNQKERSDRHEFFKANPKGADRREYVKKFLERRKAYYDSLLKELKTRAQAHDLALMELKTRQGQIAEEFEKYLKQGVRPPEALWPR